MQKGILLGLIMLACFYESNAQYGGRYGRDYRRQRIQEIQDFKPSLDVSVGYGFPNLNKYLLSDFYNYYQGSTTQSGPVLRF